MSIDGISKLPLDYEEFSIVLVAGEVFVDTTREWFLRKNSILIDQEVTGIIGGPGPFFGGLVVDDHLHLVAQPQRLEFKLMGDLMNRESNPCTDFASRYLQNVPMNSCTGVGINFKCGVGTTTNESTSVVSWSSLLSQRANCPMFHDVLPLAEVKTTYDLGERKIAVGFQEVDQTHESPSKRLVLTGNIHRDLVPNGPASQSQTISDMLGQWKRDLNDFESIVRSFFFARTAPRTKIES